MIENSTSIIEVSTFSCLPCVAKILKCVEIDKAKFYLARVVVFCLGLS